MRKLLAGAVLSVGMVWGAQAQDSAAAQIEAVIQGQIDAFLQDDFATAFTFASPAIRGVFGSPTNFETMVRQGFPMVWRPADVDYLGVQDRQGETWQLIGIRDGKGMYHTLGYQMVETPGEGWRINGVQILQQSETGA